MLRTPAPLIGALGDTIGNQEFKVNIMTKHLVAILASALSTSVAMATPVLEGTASHPKIIHGLAVGPFQFDAILSSPSDTYDSFYTNPPLTLLTADGEVIGDTASPLMLAFFNALTDLGVVGLQGVSPLDPNTPDVSLSILIPTSTRNGSSAGPFIATVPGSVEWICCGHYYGFPNNQSLTQPDQSAVTTFVSFAQTIPEPNEIALEVLALWGLVAVGGHHRKANSKAS